MLRCSLISFNTLDLSFQTAIHHSITHKAQNRHSILQDKLQQLIMAVMDSMKTAAKFTGLVVGVPLFLPIAGASCAVKYTEAYNETRIKQKLSDRDFHKFKEVMLSDEMSLDLSLKIW
ncbi:unnamed protein product [Ambrosiozyma monospora]|uniref:Unnamed protein product n=1 Tax=Ambrosiozyma monospora TaxID=43982 RepID=A0ACB5SYW6_AMBMO|nr:unnamed protein product [Ambrosiozyma monospora]